MSRSRVLLGLTLAAAVLTVAASLSAQTPIVLKMQSTWPLHDIYHETFDAWAKKVNEMAGGRLRVDVLYFRGK